MFISRQRVYWDNLDLLGVLHNAHYILLFERSRFDFWQHCGVGPNAPGFDWPYVVAKNEVNYRQAITSEQDVIVTLAVQRMGNSSVTFMHEVHAADGSVAAEGYTVLVRLDPETGRPIPWSGAFRAMVAPYMLPGA